MLIKWIMMVVLFCQVLAVVLGCAAPLVMQGVSGATPVAASSAGRGKGESFWLARYDDVIKATLRAGQVLSLELKEEKTEKNQISLHYIDGLDDKLDILVERRTETLTRIRFDVGLFGQRNMGRLMARQIKFEIARAGAFLQDWTPEEDQ